MVAILLTSDRTAAVIPSSDEDDFAFATDASNKRPT
jgi:hypothetical protein